LTMGGALAPAALSCNPALHLYARSLPSVAIVLRGAAGRGGQQRSDANT
jgi:hypothetical protein